MGTTWITAGEYSSLMNDNAEFIFSHAVEGLSATPMVVGD
jgi:hypothetical protein